jgi:hypothetical protein
MLSALARKADIASCLDMSLQCHKPTYAAQLIWRLLDHLVGKREQRRRYLPSTIRSAENSGGGCCQAPNTSLVPVYDRITFFGNSALRFARAMHRDDMVDVEINQFLDSLPDIVLVVRRQMETSNHPMAL